MLAAFAPLLVAAACGGTASPNAPTPAATGRATPAAVPPAKFTERNWGQVEFQAGSSDLGQYRAVPVELTGQVFNVEATATQVGMQIWVYPTQAEGNTVVVYPKAGNPTVHSGDQVRVEGVVDGVLVRKDDQGRTLRLPRVLARHVTVLHATAAPHVATPTPSPSPASTAYSSRAYVVSGTPAGRLNVRDGPRLGAARKGGLRNGDLVVLVRRAPAGWDEIRGADFTGFAAAEYLAGPKQVSNAHLARLRP
ncbi:MAG: SH3 domain-containing protein [Chloroflexota bacterium]